VIADATAGEEVIEILTTNGETAWQIGNIEAK
jgi:phosphoribosylaminoimidazole (AIR) synthetase